MYDLMFILLGSCSIGGDLFKRVVEVVEDGGREVRVLELGVNLIGDEDLGELGEDSWVSMNTLNLCNSKLI